MRADDRKLTVAVLGRPQDFKTLNVQLQEAPGLARCYHTYPQTPPGPSRDIRPRRLFGAAFPDSPPWLDNPRRTPQSRAALNPFLSDLRLRAARLSQCGVSLGAPEVWGKAILGDPDEWSGALGLDVRGE